MTISRGQMNRQLYMGGGIMDAMPRQQYGLGSFVKKAVKKVTGGVKDIVSSDLGKAALVGAAAFGIPGTSIGGLLGRSSFMVPAGGAPGVFGLGGIGNLFGGSAVNKALLGTADYQGGPTSMFGGAKNFLSGLSKGQKIAGAIGGASILSGLLTKAQMEEIDEADPDERGDIVAEKLRQSLTRLGVSGEELERRVAEGVSEYTGYTSKAEGGRIGFDMGGTYDDFEKFMMRRKESMSERLKEELRKQFNMYMRSKDPTVDAAEGGRIGYALGGNELPPDPTTPVNPFKPKPIGPVLPNKEMASNEISIDKIEMLIKRGADNDLIKEFTGASDGVIDQIRDAMERKNKAGGGIMNRMNYAMGDTASQNAMQAAGIEGLPVRQNPKGVKELDLRDNGGFIPPVGIKEKEDDIPAMLSNNEFVFTADAVRGMGDGDVELGAQRMYDQMKMLEKGGRV